MTTHRSTVAPALFFTVTAWLYAGHPAARAAIPAPPKPGYQPVFRQDFTTMLTLAVAPHDIGPGTWIAHTPSYQDWFTFQDPGQAYHPFGLGGGYLTIRVQKDGNDPHHWFGGYSGGLLSSMDGDDKGFAQKYGYFEASMQTPGTPNTWPAFWLEDAPSLTDETLADGAEIDVTESYGNYGTGPGQKPPGDPDQDGLAWHDWGHNGNPTTSDGIFVHGPRLTTGFHTYGVDVEPDAITWYLDRKQVWQIPTFPAARRPLFVLLNLALGGGTHNRADGKDYDWSLTPDPTDLRVKYVAVWASPNSPNYRGRTPGGEGAAPVAAGVTGSSFRDTGHRNGVRYFYRVAAVNAFGEGPRSPEVGATPGAARAAAATFLRTDATTQGNWQGAYGADGYDVIGDALRLPPYAAVTASTKQTFTWGPTTDTRALREASKPADRIASELHAGASETFDIGFADGKTHRVALYFLDYDHKGEVDGVQIKDAVFGNVLDTRAFSAFSGGQYGVWDLRGHVQIVIRNAAPAALNSQATVSGLFFGAKAGTGWDSKS